MTIAVISAAAGILALLASIRTESVSTRRALKGSLEISSGQWVLLGTIIFVGTFVMVYFYFNPLDGGEKPDLREAMGDIFAGCVLTLWVVLFWLFLFSIRLLIRGDRSSELLGRIGVKGAESDNWVHQRLVGILILLLSIVVAGVLIALRL